jgi:DNA-binding NtrC family response regulator
LLTFLDTQTFTRVGGEKVVSVNVRLIAATNRDLDAEIKAGRFREDLFFRLNVFCIRVPALRERMEDLPILTQDILPKLGEKIGRKPVPRLSVEAVDALAAYHWPGNIRELRNILERALILCQGDVISVEHLGLPRADQPNVDYIPQSRIAGLFAADMPMQQALHETKLHLVTEALRKSEGNVTRAAELLGLTRESLKHHLRTLGIRGCKPTTGG